MPRRFTPKFVGLFLRRRKDGRLLSQRRDAHGYYVIDGRDRTTSPALTVLFSGPEDVREWLQRTGYSDAYQVLDGASGNVVSVPCGICNGMTNMSGTKRCDRCWELESRIQRDPELARKILEGLKS